MSKSIQLSSLTSIKTQQIRNLTNEFLVLRENYKNNKLTNRLNIDISHYIDNNKDEIIPDWIENINEINDLLNTIKLKSIFYFFVLLISFCSG